MAAVGRRFLPADPDGDRRAGAVRRGDACRRAAHRQTGSENMSMQTPPATPSLSDPDLLRTRGFIDGQWCDADDGGSCEVTNPATGAVLGTVPDMGAAETRRASAARTAEHKS